MKIVDNFQLSATQIAALKVQHKAQRDRRFADRLKAIIHLSRGWTVGEVAEALLVDEKTIYLWLDKYQQGGTDELLTLHYQGKESKLTDAQQAELAKHLEEKTYLDSKAISQYIKKTYGVEYKPSGVKDLLDRLGFAM